MLGGLVAVAVGLRLWAALSVHAPSILPDEAAYALAGRALWHHASLVPLGGRGRYESAVYPVVSALPYTLLRALQALAWCGTGVIAFAWARRVARPAWSLAAAALTLALPGGVYAGAILPETLFVALATSAGWLAVRALAAPTRQNQAALVGALALCALTRGEANMLAIAVVASAAATRRLRALWPTWVCVVAMCVVWVALGGGAPLHSLGGGSGVYTAGTVVDLVLEHAADVALVSGLVPLCAVVLLALERRVALEVRATVVYALALALAAAVEVGAFAAGHASQLLERELVFALPPLFVGFAAWLDCGARRPRRTTLAVAAAAVAALLAMPYGRLARSAAAAENPTLVPLTHLDSAQVYGVVALFAFAAAVLLLATRRPWLLPVLLVGLFSAVSASAAIQLARDGRAARAAWAPPPAAWVQRAAARPVTYLYDGSSDWQLVWSQLFWNERIGGVLDLTATHLPGPLPQEQLQILPPDGALRLVGGATPAAPLLAAPEGFGFAGDVVARSPAAGLALWRIAPPLRVRTWAQGLEPNGDLPQGGVATLDVFDCGRGTFHVVAIGRDNETLRLSLNGTQIATTSLWPQGVWEQSVPTPASGAGGRCSFSLATSSLVHLADFRWTPA